MVQATKRTRKQRIEAAIAYAFERRWDLAAEETARCWSSSPKTSRRRTASARR